MAVSHSQSHSRLNYVEASRNDSVTVFSTSYDACLACFQFQVQPDAPANMTCWDFKCDYNMTICGTDEGYTFAGYDKQPGDGWEQCPPEVLPLTSYFSTPSDACLACDSLTLPKPPNLCWYAPCTEKLCNLSNGYTFEEYDHSPGAGWANCTHQ